MSASNSVRERGTTNSANVPSSGWLTSYVPCAAMPSSARNVSVSATVVPPLAALRGDEFGLDHHAVGGAELEGVARAVGKPRPTPCSSTQSIVPKG